MKSEQNLNLTVGVRGIMGSGVRFIFKTIPSIIVRVNLTGRGSHGKLGSLLRFVSRIINNLIIRVRHFISWTPGSALRVTSLPASCSPPSCLIRVIPLEGLSLFPFSLRPIHLLVALLPPANTPFFRERM